MPSSKGNAGLGVKVGKSGGGRAIKPKAAAKTPRRKSRRGSKPSLRAELRDLSCYIRAAKAEIASIRPEEVKDEFLPNATGELDAIAEAAAEATHAIMDAAETIDEVTKNVEPDVAGTLTVATTAIYEACGFQDITGQRIAKVVAMLKNIEDKVDALVAVFDDDKSRVRGGKKVADNKDNGPSEITDEDLLNGPQKKSEAKTQDEIDALLASLG